MLSDFRAFLLRTNREKVALEATRCRACTSDLPAAAQSSAGRA